MKISGRKRWKPFAAAAAAAAMTAAMSMTAFAQGYWVNDLSGWWYSTNEEGTAWYSNGWQWIDNDYDGIAECYYFDGSGCLVMGGVTPDGYEVSAGGAWTENTPPHMEQNFPVKAIRSLETMCGSDAKAF